MLCHHLPLIPATEVVRPNHSPLLGEPIYKVQRGVGREMGGRIGGEGGYCDGSIASGVGNLFHQLMSSDPSRPLHQRHGFLFFPSIPTSLFISQFIPLSCFTALVPSPALPRLSLAEAGWKHSHSDHILHPHPPFLFLSLSSFSRSYIIADLSRVLTLS